MNKRVIIVSIVIVLLFSFFYANHDFNSSGDFPTGLAVDGGQSRYDQLKACVANGQPLNACRLALGVSTQEEFEAEGNRAVEAGGAGGRDGKVIAGAVVAGLPTPEELHEMILANWRNNKQGLEGYVHETFSTDGTSLGRPYSLYNLQGQTNAFLRYAGKKRDIALLDELAGLYLVPLQYLEEVSEFQYSHLPEQIPTVPPGTTQEQKNKLWDLYYIGSAYPLDKPIRIWRDTTGVFSESMLDVGQFLFGVSDAFVFFLRIPAEQRTGNMQRFLNEYGSILKEHYFRWIYDDRKAYNLKGWACQDPRDPQMNGYEFTQRLLDVGFYREKSHCNYVPDASILVIGGIANLLRADAQAVENREPSLLTAEEKQKLLDYIDLATRLMISRTTESNIQNFNGESVTGYNFDVVYGLQDHSASVYAGYMGEQFPTEADKRKAVTLGWDLSHASRFPYVFTTMHDARSVTGQDWPNTEDMRRFANQFAYKNFNKDLNRPLFTNYVDGSNGWYQANVDDIKIKGRGIPPFGSSLSAPTGGWALWHRFNPDIGKVMASVWKVTRSTDIIDESDNNRIALLGTNGELTEGKIGVAVRSMQKLNPPKPLVDCGAYPALSSPQGSFETWFQLNEVGTRQNILHIYETDGKRLLIEKTHNNQIWINIKGVSWSENLYVNAYSTATIQDTLWHHLVVTQNGAGVQLYLDGTLQEVTDDGKRKGEWTGFMDMGVPTAGCDLGGSSLLSLGFVGMLDEVRFYNRALSSGEVQQHFTGQFANEEGLTAHWAFTVKNPELTNFKREYYGDRVYDNFQKNAPVEYFQPKSLIMLPFLSAISDSVDDAHG